MLRELIIISLKSGAVLLLSGLVTILSLAPANASAALPCLHTIIAGGDYSTCTCPLIGCLNSAEYSQSLLTYNTVEPSAEGYWISTPGQSKYLGERIPCTTDGHFWRFLLCVLNLAEFYIGCPVCIVDFTGASCIACAAGFAGVTENCNMCYVWECVESGDGEPVDVIEMSADGPATCPGG